jgi:Threonine dehydrogenase and related Zn-dependent dehydrogenases
MKAIVISGPGKAGMIETEKPHTGSRDVLVKVMFSGICGTDLAIFSGEMSLIRDGLIKYPVRIGHEWSGIVEEVGDGVSDFKPGDRVVSDTGVSCGECRHCLEKDYNSCENVRSLGTVNCWDGSFAEYILIPERHLYKMPDSISLEEGVLIEPATIALAGLKKCDINKDSKVLIIGTGAIGLAAIPLAKEMGAGKVMISGRKPYKLEVAELMGVDVIINSTSQDLKTAVLKETDGKGANVIIETSGNIAVINQCADILKYGGIMALIGFYEANLHDFNIDKFVMKCAQMKGILGELGMPQDVINMRQKGNFSFRPLITHTFDFDDAIEAMRTAEEKNDTKIKMLVKIG